ncbi:MAG: sulfotransferase domain-containing protein [Cyclobacteriaceae bacterium]
MKQPAFIIIGAQKCGTSTLFDLLSRHPQLEGSKKKEIHYFDRNFEKSYNWYLSHWSVRTKKILFEASPSYLYFPYVPKRIHSVNPNIKLIVILRNPVERAHSAWKMYHLKFNKQHKRNDVHDHRTFNQALQEEIDHLESGNGYKNMPYSYIERGLYSDQIRRYLQFFAGESILFLNFDDFSDLRGVGQKCTKFLKIRPFEKVNSLEIHSNQGPKQKLTMKKEILQEMKRRYEIGNRDIKSLTGMDFDWSD